VVDDKAYVQGMCRMPRFEESMTWRFQRFDLAARGRRFGWDEHHELRRYRVITIVCNRDKAMCKE